MQGQILVFNEQKQTGAIVASNGQRFSFEIGHWHDVVTPERGMSVDFSLDENNQIQQIRLALPGTNFRAGQTASWPQRPKSKPVLTVLTIFLGIFGAHRFYMGGWGWGLVQSVGFLFLSTLFTLLLPPLAGLLYLTLFVLTWVEAIRYIWMSDIAFEAKVKAYQAEQPGPFGYFW